MFKKPKEGEKSLREHLIEDLHTGEDNDVLNIIDDYHVKNISDEAIEFYVDSFLNTGIKRLTLYYQIYNGKFTSNQEREIKIIASNCNTNESIIVSFLTLCFGRFKKEDSIIEKIKSENGKYVVKRITTNVLKFIDQMADVGIEVWLKPYDNLRLRPPFHGRYWLNKEAGYIVDGSLDTFLKHRVFAQLMDEENYEIISELFKKYIIPGSQRYGTLDGPMIKALSNHFLAD